MTILLLYCSLIIRIIILMVIIMITITNDNKNGNKSKTIMIRRIIMGVVIIM